MSMNVAVALLNNFGFFIVSMVILVVLKLVKDLVNGLRAFLIAKLVLLNLRSENFRLKLRWVQHKCEIWQAWLT